MNPRKILFCLSLALLFSLAAIGVSRRASASGRWLFESSSAPKTSQSFSTNAVAAAPLGVKLQRAREMRASLPVALGAGGGFNAEEFQALGMATGDVDADGAPDLVSGYGKAGSGVLLLWRGNPEAFSPSTPETLSGIQRGRFPESFLREPRLLEMPEAPDFLAMGDFTADGALDLIAAARGGQNLYLFPGAGKGEFGEMRQVALSGKATAMTTAEIDQHDGRMDVLVGIIREEGPALLAFGGDLTTATPRAYALPAVANDIAIGLLDRDTVQDAAIVADGRVWILQGEQAPTVDSAAAARLEAIGLQGYARALAIGEFLPDRDARAEIAVLTEDGDVQVLTRGEIDVRPQSAEEVRAFRVRYGRGRPDPSKVQEPGLLDRLEETVKSVVGINDEPWTMAQRLSGAAKGIARDAAGVKLITARLSGQQAEDLLVGDGAGFQILSTREERPADGGIVYARAARAAARLGTDETVAILPMRLNVMGQPGLVYLEAKKFPITAPAAPAAVFSVTKTTDTNDGACNADCSLREAIRAANASLGADVISLPAGTYTLTLAGANENAAATGDLDITDALTITGGGAASTIVQAGASAGPGIDKVLSINPNFTTAFATSLSGLTIRFGRNTSGFSGDGFGGGLDWEASSTGTLSISNCTITQNTTADGDGGGLAITNVSGAPATVTITGTTISSNQPARVGAASPLGGGIFQGTLVALSLTNSTISSNLVTGSAGAGQGGGIFAFQQSTEVMTLNGCTVSSNQAPSDGGGLRSATRLVIDSSIFSGNASGAQGGGINHNQNNATASSITKTNFVNNSATASGGGFRSGSGSVNNAVTMSFNRFAGNAAPTGSGLAAFNGAVTAQNNWWTCNAGPGTAPCQRAQVEAGGTGSINFTPWITLAHSASPTSIELTPTLPNTSTLTASFLQNSAGAAQSASNLTALVGVSISFSNPAPTLGTISVAQTTIQATGTATATFTSTAGGTDSVDATVDGQTASASITIQAPPTITGVAALSRTQGVAGSNSQIATVADGNQAANTLSVVVNGAASATVNGVTVSGIAIDASGNVTANVAASCTASNASFTLTVTDATSKTATVGLTVNVVTNPAPTLGTYPTTNVAPSGGTTVTPSAAPTDNVSVASVTASAPGFTGTFSGNPTTGVITISNAGPAGVYTVTVTATDSCGATATTTFSLTVNNAPTISGATISRTAGSAASSSQIATVSDTDQAANTLAVTVNAGASATVNSVTVSGIAIDASGNVTANVAAACGASNASFTLTVTDNRGTTANATLTVNVSANTAPTLGAYSATTASTGGNTTVTPSAAPTDNGSVASVTASAPGFTGTFSGSAATGVITITNAGPAGSYTVTVTATDNCGATATTTFGLTVGAAPTISGATLSRQAGSPSANSQIATVGDSDQAANTLTVTINGGASATVNGVSVSNLSINAAGSVTADVVAACGATTATFSLAVSDSQSNTASGTLTVNVSANTAPTLGSYTGTSVASGGSTTVTPTAAPSDNGSVSSVTVSAPGYTGTISVNASGVVSISNAGPVGGPYTVTVTATDNCGVASTASFGLAVTSSNTPPTITGATVSAQRGGPSAVATIATVGDIDQACNTLSVTLTPVSGSGVTVTGVAINGSCQVTATIAASCSAANSTFNMTVQDASGATANALLTVNVTANPAPSLGTYSAVSVAAGGSTTATPTAPPADNVSVSSVTVSAPGFTGTLSVNASGVVSIGNAGPAGGPYTVTVTVADNCGTSTSRTFGLTVTGGGGGGGGCATVNPATLPQPYVAVPYVRILSANPSGSYSFSVSAGALPPGLSLVTAFGITSIAGIPQTPGTYNFTIKAVKNSGNCEGTRSYTFTIPATVVPILECVRRGPNKTYIATFGYMNSTGAAVTIPVGTNNYFAPGSQNRGQVTTFQPGRINNAFTVTFKSSGSNLGSWFLKGPDGVLRPITISTWSSCP
ncbi:MAG: CSLREA domain-containing protein [Blastocatellia bacterium]|nr:CSLREA domain-containing protein [Blastocatellia bacterium]